MQLLLGRDANINMPWAEWDDDPRMIPQATSVVAFAQVLGGGVGVACVTFCLGPTIVCLTTHGC